jgi:hypothetical protein
VQCCQSNFENYLELFVLSIFQTSFCFDLKQNYDCQKIMVVASGLLVAMKIKLATLIQLKTYIVPMLFQFFLLK